MKKVIFSGSLIVAVVVLLVAGRLFYLERSHFQKAEGYFGKAEWKLAITEYSTTIRFYLPFSPYVDKSAGKLWQMAQSFEGDGKPDWAKFGYSSLRSSFYSARSFYTPGVDWINKCDEKIADINVKMLIKEGIVNPSDYEKEKAKHLFTLKVDRAPKPFWTLIAGISFFGWIGSVLLGIFKGFDDTGIPKKNIVYYLVGFLLFFSVWIVSLSTA